MPRRAHSVGFSVSPEDSARLDRMVAKFGHGSRNVLLRVALDTMEAVDRAERQVWNLPLHAGPRG